MFRKKIEAITFSFQLSQDKFISKNKKILIIKMPFAIVAIQVTVKSELKLKLKSLIFSRKRFNLILILYFFMWTREFREPNEFASLTTNWFRKNTIAPSFFLVYLSSESKFSTTRRWTFKLVIQLRMISFSQLSEGTNRERLTVGKINSFPNLHDYLNNFRIYREGGVDIFTHLFNHVRHKFSH